MSQDNLTDCMVSIDPGITNTAWVDWIDGVPVDAIVTKMSKATRAASGFFLATDEMVPEVCLDVVVIETQWAAKGKGHTANGLMKTALLAGLFARYAEYCMFVPPSRWRAAFCRGPGKGVVADAVKRVYPEFYELVMGDFPKSHHEHIFDAVGIGHYAVCGEGTFGEKDI